MSSNSIHPLFLTFSSVWISGSDLVLATVSALEVTTKLFYSYYSKLKPYSQSLLTPVALPSSVGAAAGCAQLLKLDRDGVRNSCAIAAGTVTVCPAEYVPH